MPLPSLFVLMLATPSIVHDKPLAGAVICVDAGHGGQTYSKSYTGGTVGVTSKLTEGELNLRVAKELVKALEADNATVHLSRTADHRLSRTGSPAKDELGARVEFFEHHGCHFFVSVHHNAAAASASGKPASGHTAIYKHNATDDTLYEALAREVNDALAAAVPGPKRKLIKESYHLTRETNIPGTISEAGFMTNPDYDRISSRADYPPKEAAALAAAAMTYWRTHKAALQALRDKLAAERATKKVDADKLANIALNPAFQKEMTRRLAAIAPEGQYDAARVADYFKAFRAMNVATTSDLTAVHENGTIRLRGKLTDRTEHDAFIDVLVAMRLLNIMNDCTMPKRTTADPAK